MNDIIIWNHGSPQFMTTIDAADGPAKRGMIFGNWLAGCENCTWDSRADDHHFFEFEGTVVELFAPLVSHFSPQLALLLDLAVGFFDPTKILLLSIGWHMDDYDDLDCKDDCSLARLLKRGADPNGHGYRICPMQIAVAVRDLDRVRVLFEAGADPNCTDDRDGEAWEEGSIHAEFNIVIDRSPLNILETVDCDFDVYRKQVRKANEPLILDLLHRYGARNYMASHWKRSELLEKEESNGSGDKTSSRVIYPSKLELWRPYGC
ncbi:hypothetical protein V8F06_009299 [Rhypophila decipiens]